MKAIRVHEHGDYDVLRVENLPIPEPGPGQVRIKVAWGALNHLDTWVRRGVPGHRFPLPMTPGCDFSGVVDAVGAGVVTCKPGARVAVAPGHSCGVCRRCGEGKQNLCHKYGIYGETEDGGNAEFAVVDAHNVMPVPDAFPLDLAAAFPLAYLTAWHMLVKRCAVQPGDKVLIHAAGSGVSAAATQIARLHGARVFVTAGSDDKVSRGVANGAEAGVNYRENDWVPAVKEWAGRGGLDIIVDHVGVDTLPKGLWLLARGGRVVTCGVTSGAEMKLNMAPVFFKTLSVLGSTMGGLGEQKQVADLVFSGSLTPIVDSRYPLEQVADAHRRMNEREVFGKILLQVDPELK
ncbi:MAG: zinc-binding dehydrogenase [Planctomycetes bacterium]|nr:zinc-binding dehydrogenase [Planctomycetota bacterium]